MRRAIFHPAALEELENSVRFYDARAKGLGNDFTVAVERVVTRIIENPKIVAPMDRGIRRYLVPGFPFALLYRMVGEDIRILAVMHTRRRPGYWRKRR